MSRAVVPMTASHEPDLEPYWQHHHCWNNPGDSGEFCLELSYPTGLTKWTRLECVAEQRDDLRRSSETCNPLVEVNNIIEVVDDCDSE